MLVDGFDALLLDLDSVLYQSYRPFPEARRVLETLRGMGKALRFITNDPRPTRQEVVDKLRGMGMAASLEEVVTSGWTAARWLQARLRPRSPVLVVGSTGLATEVRDAGLTVTDKPDECVAVLMGCDEVVGYTHLRHASMAIRRGALFVATNRDATFHTAQGPWPATGALVQAVELASGRSPAVVGKPFRPIFDLALASLDGTVEKLLPSRIAMVGDSLEADITGARCAGVAAVWVDRSGRTPAPAVVPDYVVHSLDDLLHDVAPYQPVLGLPVAQRVEPGVAAVVLDQQGRVLLGLRADLGAWGIPTGHVEPGETAQRAVVREVREETGLEVAPEYMVGVYSDPCSQTFRYPDGRIVQFVTISFLCRPVGGEVRPDGREMVEAGFFAPDQIPSPLMPMHPDWLRDALEGQRGVAK